MTKYLGQQPKEGKIPLGLYFIGFCPRLSGWFLRCFRSKVGAECHGDGSTAHGIQEARRRHGKGLGTAHTFTRHDPGDLLPPARLYLLHSPNTLLHCESIEELIRRLDSLGSNSLSIIRPPVGKQVLSTCDCAGDSSYEQHTTTYKVSIVLK